LWSVFDFVLPRYLGKVKAFVSKFSRPIETNRDEDALATLKRMTEPFMLRRVKEDKTILADLPEKIVSKFYTSLSQEQAALYESVRSEVFNTLDKEDPEGSGATRSGLILKLLGALKQVCNHPACYGDKPDVHDATRSNKTLAVLELIEPVIAAGEKVSVIQICIRLFLTITRYPLSRHIFLTRRLYTLPFYLMMHA
jgi:SNF2 family DNA or RNA helicase